jgi:hypothetical protein
VDGTFYLARYHHDADDNDRSGTSWVGRWTTISNDSEKKVIELTPTEMFHVDKYHEYSWGREPAFYQDQKQRYEIITGVSAKNIMGDGPDFMD